MFCKTVRSIYRSKHNGRELYNFYGYGYMTWRVGLHYVFFITDQKIDLQTRFSFLH